MQAMGYAIIQEQDRSMLDAHDTLVLLKVKPLLDLINDQAPRGT
jgi:hypothetical protein